MQRDAPTVIRKLQGYSMRSFLPISIANLKGAILPKVGEDMASKHFHILKARVHNPPGGHMPFDPAIPFLKRLRNRISSTGAQDCAKPHVLVRMWRSWGEGKPVKPLWEPVWWCLKKLNTALPCDPAIPL